jgi:hypothetical protein
VDRLSNLAGDEGEELASKIWAEVTEALRRDLPEVDEVVKTLPEHRTAVSSH